MFIVGGMPCPKTGATHIHAQLGIIPRVLGQKRRLWAVDPVVRLSRTADLPYEVIDRKAPLFPSNTDPLHSRGAAQLIQLN